MNNEPIIAACGNDCSVCPRYNKEPYKKTTEELIQTAMLWKKLGYRDKVVSIEEISCNGCNVDNWCRYNIKKCTVEKGIDNCSSCTNYPCSTVKECFEITKSFEPRCREVCNQDEYETLKKAFFEKEINLKKDL